MGKKKKKTGKRFNPHKLDEKELIYEIERLVVQGKTDRAFVLAKVLLDKHDSVKNRNLFRSVIADKISRMEEKGLINEISELINEARKRFDAELLSEVEAFNKIRMMNDVELIAHFTNAENIPEPFQIRIADHLFFSDSIEKEFIRNHKRFKDLFYVREAFCNGFDPKSSRKLLSGIDSTSPFRHWLLLCKAIEAFYDDDYTMLEVLDRKTRESSFPRFLIGKLFQCQVYLEGKSDRFVHLSKTDLDIFETLCGNGFLKACVYNRALDLSRRGDLNGLLRTLNVSRTLLGTKESSYLFVFFYGVAFTHIMTSKQDLPDPKFLKTIPRIDWFYLTREHFFLKFVSPESLSVFELQEIVDLIVQSSALSACEFFKQEVLKAELLFRLAKNVDKYHENSLSRSSFLDELFEGMEDDIHDKSALLEECLDLSHHNAEIFTSLIDEYIDLNEKTSTINGVVNKLLEKFPENPRGYKLAGDIAYQNRTYRKALGFYEKAHRLMPLNREFSLTILACYDQIIAKRKKADIHLIEKDLEKAKAFVNSANRKAVMDYNLLKAKGLFKITEYNPSASNRYYPVIAGLAGPFMDRPEVLFRYLNIFHGTPLGENFINRYLSQPMDQLVQMLDAKAFSAFLSVNMDPENRLTGSEAFFNVLLLAFFKREKQNPAATIDDISGWLLFSLKKRWHALFIALICLGTAVKPQHPAFLFFLEITRNRINYQQVRQCLLDPGTVGWFQSKLGYQILGFLLEYHNLFEDLYEILSSNGPVDPTDELEEMLDEHPQSFSHFKSWFLEDMNRDDRTPLESVEEIFGYINDLPKKQFKTSDSPEKTEDVCQLSIFDLLEE